MVNLFFPLSKGRLSVAIKEIINRNDDETISSPYVKLTLGHNHYRSTPEELLNRRFDFHISLHAHLFWTLQVDLYDHRGRLLGSPVHLGRGFVRLLLRLRRKPFDSVQLYDLEGLAEREASHYETGVDLMVEIIYRRETANRNNSVSSMDTQPANEQAEQERSLDEAEERAAEVGDAKEKDEEELPADFNPEQSSHVSLFQRISGWFVSDVEYAALSKLMDLIMAFGQGIEVSNFSLSVGYSILSRYFGDHQTIFTNNLVITKSTFEIPRLLYKFALATYGWRGLYVFGKTRITESIRSNADLHACLDFLAIPKSEMLIFELGEVSALRPNFFVCIDRRLSAVILSIRGTMSLRDVLIDLSCEYIEWRDGLAHSGMLSAAQWFIENVGRQLILIAQEHGLENVYIVGHSMGGSIGALVTILLIEHLRESASWPCIRDTNTPISVHGYCYGPAPVVSQHIASRWVEHVDTFIVGEDLVPHLCYGSVIDLQCLLVLAAELGSPSLMFRSVPIEILDRLEQCRKAMLSKPNRNPKLSIVGRIHHLQKLRAPQNRSYHVLDTCTDERFRELVIRPKMFVHHLPSKYAKSLDKAYACFIAQELEEKGESIRVMRELAESLARQTSPLNNLPLTSTEGSSSCSNLTIMEKEELMEEISAAPPSPIM